MSLRPHTAKPAVSAASAVSAPSAPSGIPTLALLGGRGASKATLEARIADVEKKHDEFYSFVTKEYIPVEAQKDMRMFDDVNALKRRVEALEQALQSALSLRRAP